MDTKMPTLDDLDSLDKPELQTLARRLGVAYKTRDSKTILHSSIREALDEIPAGVCPYCKELMGKIALGGFSCIGCGYSNGR